MVSLFFFFVLWSSVSEECLALLFFVPERSRRYNQSFICVCACFYPLKLLKLSIKCHIESKETTTALVLTTNQCINKAYFVLFFINTRSLYFAILCAFTCPWHFPLENSWSERFWFRKLVSYKQIYFSLISTFSFTALCCSMTTQLSYYETRFCCANFFRHTHCLLRLAIKQYILSVLCHFFLSRYEVTPKFKKNQNSNWLYKCTFGVHLFALSVVGLCRNRHHAFVW